jgi:C4-dicarboxylate transporter/malic acid transport protein
MKIIQNFAPSWFAGIMGTGILAICSYFFSSYIPALKTLSFYLFYFNVFMFFIFSVPWVLRWIFFYKNAKSDLLHPVLCAFYPTFAVAMLVIAGGFIVIVHNIKIAQYFWICGAVLMILFAFIVPVIMFSHENIKIEHINPGWYIPPVGLIVIPIAGAFFQQTFTGYPSQIITLVNFFGWGSGFFLYIALLCIIVYRLILHTPLPGKSAPTIWINLGPIGAGSIALINIVNHTPFIHTKEPFYIFTLIFWGFGLWWLVTAIIMTLIYIKKSQLNYSMSWWAFIFPLGAFCASSHLIAKITGFGIINFIGFAIFWLLLFIWTVTFYSTLKNIKLLF